MTKMEAIMVYLKVLFQHYLVDAVKEIIKILSLDKRYPRRDPN
jgi:hypothetical protein